MKRKLLSVFVFLSLLFSQAYGQGDNSSVKQVIEKLKAFSAEYIAEKAYLHFDKPYYAAGDTIYFKAYLTLGSRHQLSALSGVLHIDLINTNNKVDQSIKLQMINGIGWGDFALPDSLPKGNYRVSAYTQWMRNDGEDSFFDKTIAIGSALNNNKTPESSTERKTAANAKPDLQFFPEGGELVEGIPSKVAFKAVDSNGLGIAVNGIVADNTGKEVSTFSATHLGMGYFYLKPEAGKTYQAKVTYANGIQDIANLPQTGTKGITLKINNDSLDKVDVQLIANEKYFAENKDKKISLLIYSNGIATTVSVKLDSAIINLAILKRRLHSGITKITLFSGSGEPLSERLIFIQNYDQLKLTVNTAKLSYKKRDSVKLNLNAFTRADSAANGHFSVSVIDERKVPVDENTESTIFNYLLLSSDLKGYVEQPNYYFTNVNGKTRAALDLVMLTHGYRRFEWKHLLNDEYPPIAYQPENSLEINGIAKNAFGKPLVKGTVSLVSTQQKNFISTATDDKGRFRFSNLIFTDSAKFVLQAVNARGKNTTQLVYEKEKPLQPTFIKQTTYAEDVNNAMPAYLDNMKQQQEQAIKYGTARGIMLREVRIKQKRKNENDYRSSNIVGPGHADQVMHAKEIEQISGQLATSLNGRLRGIAFSNPQDPSGGIPYLRGLIGGAMSIVVDGVELPGGMGVNVLNPNTIETIEVLKFASASIYGMHGGNGVLVITTKQGGQDPNDIAAVGILPITVAGFYKAREFYTPKYDHDDGNFRKPDLRSTIYWNPELVTDKDGNASFSYFNADGSGSYRVVVEGIDDKGNLGRQVYRYKVE